MSARRELSDRLSPIAVKELRQGVRGQLFTGAFLLHQLLVMGVAMLALIPGSRDSTDGLFWAVVMLPLLLVLPSSAAGAINAERHGGTLEPLLLTGLSARRIVSGKWLAVAAQAGLLLMATLPYLLARYFLGGVDLARELSTLLVFLACSALLTSMTLALAPAPVSALFRWAVLAVVGLFATTTLFSMVLSPRMGGPRAWLAPFALVLCAATAIGLEAAALQLTTPNRAHPAALRLLGLVAAVAAAWAGASSGGDPAQGVTWTWAGALVGGVCLASLCQPTPALPSLYAPYFRRPVLFPLAPGWPGAVVYVLLLAGALGIGLIQALPLLDAVRIAVGLAATLLLPVALLRLQDRRLAAPALYLLIQFASTALRALAPIGEAVESETLWQIGDLVAGACPLGFALGLVSDTAFFVGSRPPSTLGHVGFWAVTAVVIGLAMRRSARAWAALRAAAREPRPAQLA